MRVLIAGMGNVLHGDDGFGVAVAERLAERRLPTGVDVIEVGIGGIHLVQHLHEGYDALIVVDAVDRHGEPGTVYVLEAAVPEISDYSDEERHELMTDIHYTVPSKAMIVARALDCLPARAWIVGCQPKNGEQLGIGLSDVVQRGVAEAVDRIETLVRGMMAKEALDE